jgi:hypothetical protein
MNAHEIIETLTFWLLLTLICALMVVVADKPFGYLFLPHVMLSAANLGAKCVRKEIAEEKSQSATKAAAA